MYRRNSTGPKWKLNIVLFITRCSVLLKPCQFFLQATCQACLQHASSKTQTKVRAQWTVNDLLFYIQSVAVACAYFLITKPERDGFFSESLFFYFALSHALNIPPTMI